MKFPGRVKRLYALVHAVGHVEPVAVLVVGKGVWQPKLPGTLRRKKESNTSKKELSKEGLSESKNLL